MPALNSQETSTAFDQMLLCARARVCACVRACVRVCVCKGGVLNIGSLLFLADFSKEEAQHPRVSENISPAFAMI